LQLLAVFLLLLLGSNPLFGRQSEPAERVRARLEQLRTEFGFPGITAAATFRKGRSFTVSVGLADVESARALKPQDRMLAGSTGKTFVAAAALKLVEEGKLTLDEPASKRLGSEPWFKRLPNAESLTVRHLMRHTSGIPEHVLDPEFLNAIKANPRRVWRPSELLA
jgi:D-alanyl-D-alanine carboxypeptidase